jgi:hypothetical protein
MTKNGVRVPCWCPKCNGDARDYRTVAVHARLATANRPLFPTPLDAPSVVIHNYPDVQQATENEELSAQDPILPRQQPDSEDEEIVSHVQALPNCNVPIYDSVQHMLIDV